MKDLKDSRQILKKFISETSFIETNLIKDESLIFQEGIFDSMGLMSLITFLEDNFNIQIKDTELVEQNFESVNAIITFLEIKKNNHDN
jgi:acyl carrier protein